MREVFFLSRNITPWYTISIPNKFGVIMRNPQTIINEAELLAGTVAHVYRWLETRYAKSDGDDVGGDKELEASLLNSRASSTHIKLALARFCFYSETATRLWNEVPRDNDNKNYNLRHCLLSNQRLGSVLPNELPYTLFENKNRFEQWLKGASDHDLFTLFENQKIKASFLRNLFEGDECWQAMDEGRQLITIEALTRNKRIRAMNVYSASGDLKAIDTGWTEIIDAGWKLAKTVPTTKEWARALDWFYQNLPPKAFSVKDPLAVAARWFPDPNDTEFIKKETGNVSEDCNYQGVRRELAKLALNMKPDQKSEFDLMSELFNSEDPAFPEAAQQVLLLENQCHDPEPETPVTLVLRNLPRKPPILYDTSKYKEVLHMSKYSSLFYNTSYIPADYIKEMAKEHPDWLVVID